MTKDTSPLPEALAKLKALALAAINWTPPEPWQDDRSYSDAEVAGLEFNAAANPSAILALIAQLEAQVVPTILDSRIVDVLPRSLATPSASAQLEASKRAPAKFRLGEADLDAMAVELPIGGVMFLNNGHYLGDNESFADISRQHCGGSGHKDDVRAPAAGEGIDLHAAVMNFLCDDTAALQSGDAAAYKLGHRDARHAAAELVASQVPAAPPVTPKHIEEIKDLMLWPMTEDDARAARDMLQSLHFDLSMAQCSAEDQLVASHQAIAVDAIPDELRRIGELIRTQDNDCTADPVFQVERERIITGIDTDFDPEIVWCIEDDNYFKGDEEFDALETAFEKDGTVPSDYTRTGCHRYWDFVTLFFTRADADQFIEKHGHKYEGKIRVSIETDGRNKQLKFIRDWLASLPAIAAMAKEPK